MKKPVTMRGSPTLRTRGPSFAFMPELQWRWGYFGALALMAVLGTALVAFFRRRRWL